MSKRSGLVNKSALVVCIPIFLLIILSCNTSKPPPREYFIPREELVGILVDMHMADALQASLGFRDLSLDYDSIDLYSEIFLQHGTTKLAFDSTMVYYSKNPRDLVSIYDEVIMKMTMINDSLQIVNEE